MGKGVAMEENENPNQSNDPEETPDKDTRPSPPQQVTPEGEILPPAEPETFEEAPEDAEPDFEAEEVHEDE